MSATAAPPKGNPTRKVTGLVVWYVVLGAVGWGSSRSPPGWPIRARPSAPRSAEATTPTPAMR